MSEEPEAEVGRAVALGALGGEHISIRVLSRRTEPDYWDGNWMTCAIAVRAGGFRGGFEAFLRTDEFRAFLRELDALDATRRGTARFSSLEEQLSLALEGDGHGHIAVACSVRDQAGVGNLLQCRFTLDQTYLAPLRRQVNQLLERYPVRGTPAA